MSAFINNPLQTIDFSALSIEKNENQLIRGELATVAQQMLQGFANHGFVYIRNHGIESERVFCASDSFFGLSNETKAQYTVKKHGSDKHGYVPVNGELLGTNTRNEYRECFNVTTTNSAILPEKDCPGFTAVVDEFYRRCSFLTLRILRALAIALQLEDEEYFSKIHLPMDTVENFSTLRLINYPPMTDTRRCDESSSIRCGEHSDYGTITLLFQDDTGGLEVKTRSGDYFQVKPIPDTIVVNVGNILEYMTAGRFVAARHRVILDGRTGLKRRRSIAFFAHPVHDVMVQRLQEPKDTNPISCYDFVKNNFDATYVI